MTRQLIQITGNALSIAREIADAQKKLKENVTELEKNFRDSRQVLFDNYNKRAAEDFERLRFAMSLPMLEDPALDSRYIDYNVAFIQHGPQPKQPHFLESLFGVADEDDQEDQSRPTNLN